MIRARGKRSTDGSHLAGTERTEEGKRGAYFTHTFCRQFSGHAAGTPPRGQQCCGSRSGADHTAFLDGHLDVDSKYSVSWSLNKTSKVGLLHVCRLPSYHKTRTQAFYLRLLTTHVITDGFPCMDEIG